VTEAAAPVASTGLRARVTAARRETVLVFAAVGLVAIHSLDDNFVQPQPGTLAGDHLVSGLVPLAVLAAALALHTRSRPGVRAVIALLLGFLALLVSSESVYYAREVGPSGDDFTGFLAIPAGLVLIGVGLVTLWRTRRRDDSPPWRYTRRLLLALAAVLSVPLLLYPLAESYVVTHVARAVVPPANLGAPFEDVEFTTSDGLQLHGWYVPSENGAAVIVFPGRSGPQKPARVLVEHGYGVLLFDRRGEGESDGDPNALGWSGVPDLNAAVAFLQGRADVDPNRIGGIGLSVGGELLLQAAVGSDALKAVVSEGAGIRSVREALDASGTERLVAAPVWTVTTAATAVFDNSAPPPNLTGLVAQIAPRPVFLIFSTNGQGGEQLSSDYYAAAGDPKELWEIPDAGHTGGITAHPEEYERRVVGFFDRALLQAT
jgi:fermentation-respiration switch protein FrsA (DUF1100 family)